MLLYLSTPNITRIMDRQKETETERAREKYFYLTTLSTAKTNAGYTVRMQHLPNDTDARANVALS